MKMEEKDDDGHKAKHARDKAEEEEEGLVVEARYLRGEEEQQQVTATAGLFDVRGQEEESAATGTASTAQQQHPKEEEEEELDLEDLEAGKLRDDETTAKETEQQQQEESISEIHKDPLAIGVPLPVLRKVKKPKKEQQQRAAGGGGGERERRDDHEEAGTHTMHLARVNRSSFRRPPKQGKNEEQWQQQEAPDITGGGGETTDEIMDKCMAIHTSINEGSNQVLNNNEASGGGAEDDNREKAHIRREMELTRREMEVTRREMELTHHHQQQQQLEGGTTAAVAAGAAAPRTSRRSLQQHLESSTTEALVRRTSIRSLPGAFSVDGIGDDPDHENSDDSSSIGANSLPLTFEFEFLAEATLVVEESRRDHHRRRDDDHEGGSNNNMEDANEAENSHSRSDDGMIACARCDLSTSRTATATDHHDTPQRSATISAEFSLPSVDQELEASVTIIEASPLQDNKDNCNISKRNLKISIVIGAAVVIIMAVIMAIMMSNNKDSSSPPSNNSPKFNDDTILCDVPEPICFSLIPLMTNESNACPDPTTLPHGGPLPQLVADGLLEASDPDAQIDIALINGGAMRRDIRPGPLSAGTVRSFILPFVEDWVVYLSVTPAQLKASLESSLYDTGYVISMEQQKQFFPESPAVNLTWSFESHYPYTAGLRYNVNLTAPEGERFTDFEIQTRQASGVRGWYPLDVTNNITLLRVLTSNYLADGGDGYFPEGIPEKRKEVQEDLGVTDLFLLYCSEQSEIIGPDVPDGMSTQIFVPLEGF